MINNINKFWRISVFMPLIALSGIAFAEADIQGEEWLLCVLNYSAVDEKGKEFTPCLTRHPSGNRMFRYKIQDGKGEVTATSRQTKEASSYSFRFEVDSDTLSEQHNILQDRIIADDNTPPEKKKFTGLLVEGMPLAGMPSTGTEVLPFKRKKSWGKKKEKNLSMISIKTKMTYDEMINDIEVAYYSDSSANLFDFSHIAQNNEKIKVKTARENHLFFSKEALILFQNSGLFQLQPKDNESERQPLFVYLSSKALSISILVDPVALNITDYQPEQIVAYFDDESDLVKMPTQNGFYRVYLNKTAQGDYLLQDFYQNSHNKRTDPYRVKAVRDFQRSEQKTLEGHIASWYENGLKMTEGDFKNGDGILTFWNESGQKWTDVVIKKGKPEEDGLMTLWHENGQKWAQKYYKNNKQEGLSLEWYDNGQKSSEKHYKNDKEEGVATFWYENGQKALEEHYKKGKREGLWLEWHPNGQKKTEGQYKNGV